MYQHDAILKTALTVIDATFAVVEAKIFVHEREALMGAVQQHVVHNAHLLDPAQTSYLQSKPEGR